MPEGAENHSNYPDNSSKMHFYLIYLDFAVKVALGKRKIRVSRTVSTILQLLKLDRAVVCL